MFLAIRPESLALGTLQMFRAELQRNSSKKLEDFKDMKNKTKDWALVHERGLGKWKFCLL